MNLLTVQKTQSREFDLWAKDWSGHGMVRLQRVGST